MGRLSEVDRKDIFDKFIELEFKVSSLKEIVQNEMDITEDTIYSYSKKVEATIGQLSNLSNRTYVKLLESLQNDRCKKYK